MITMYNSPDEIPAGTKMTKGDTNDVPYSVVQEWITETKGKWESTKKKKITVGD